MKWRKQKQKGVKKSFHFHKNEYFMMLVLSMLLHVSLSFSTRTIEFLVSTYTHGKIDIMSAQSFFESFKWKRRFSPQQESH